VLERALSENEVVQMVDGLLQEAEKAGASDIHLHILADNAAIDFRLDGVLKRVRTLPVEEAKRWCGRLKYLAKLKTYQESLPQDGRIPKEACRTKTDIRVSCYPTVTGEKIVLRLFAPEVLRLEDLGYNSDLRTRLERFLRQPSGMLLLTGPAGSGKTTTIYACLQYLATAGGRHIITVEDPVEQIVPGITQTETNDTRGLTFAEAGKRLLRQDPQVLVIGEIRDPDTANLVARASLTGHLVISTLHAGSCVGVLDRMLEMSNDQYALTSGLSLIVNQRLLRRLCGKCQGTGCGECFNTGYHGRVPVAEWMALEEVQREALRRGNLATLKPGCTLATAAREAVASGLSNQAEAERVIGL
jgi:type II secretory ATPase GspE/PulE/Tfp pilus assembly ATPase PilB-like protein